MYMLKQKWEWLHRSGSGYMLVPNMASTTMHVNLLHYNISTAKICLLCVHWSLIILETVDSKPAQFRGPIFFLSVSAIQCTRGCIVSNL